MKKLFVILFGIVFIGVGVFVVFRGNQLKKNCTKSVVGTVVEIEEKEESNSDDSGYTTYYYPVVEYKAGGKTVHKTGREGSSHSAYQVNDKVDIMYDPNDVETFYIKGEGTGGIFGYIFIALGGIVAVFGVFAKVE